MITSLELSLFRIVRAVCCHAGNVDGEMGKVRNARRRGMEVGMVMRMLKEGERGREGGRAEGEHLNRAVSWNDDDDDDELCWIGCICIMRFWLWEGARDGV